MPAAEDDGRFFGNGRKTDGRGNGMKIAIIGYSGSGKSTLAKRLAEAIGCEPLYLDTVNFLPNWAVRDREEGRAIVREVMKQNDWVIDGNYRAFLREERLSEADEIIWMRYPRLVCLARAFRRYWTNRNGQRESLANGCAEKLDWEFIRWILHDGRTRERVNGYREIAARYPQKTVVLRNDRQRRAYLRSRGICES